MKWAIYEISATFFYSSLYIQYRRGIKAQALTIRINSNNYSLVFNEKDEIEFKLELLKNYS